MNNNAVSIESLQQACIEALLNADIVTLEKLFDIDLTWCHSNGYVDSKASFIQQIADGLTHVIAMERSDTKCFACAGCLTEVGILDLIVEVDGNRLHMLSRYAASWLQCPEGWRLYLWQSTSLPD